MWSDSSSLRASAGDVPLARSDSIVAVIDPGVGTERGIVYAEIDGRHYVAPDNGLLSLLARDHSPSRIVACENREYWQPVISATFHGRDIMAPVAAHLSLGLDPGKLGPSLEDVLHLEWPEARILANKIEGEIVAVDSFGNLVTNITADMLAPAIGKPEVVVCCDEHETIGIYRTHGDHPPMTLIALVGSSGKLELAIVNDNARTMLGVCEGEKVIVKW